MASAILSVITMLLPLAIKLIMYWIDKKKDNDELKRIFLDAFEKMEHDLPVKMRDKHRAQIERIKQKLGEGK